MGTCVILSDCIAGKSTSRLKNMQMDCGKRQLFWGFSMSFQGKWRKLSTACRRQNVCHEFVCDPHICRLPSAEKLLPSVHNLGICRGGKLLLAVPPKMKSTPPSALPKQLANIYSLIVSAIESVQTHSHSKKPAHTFVQHPGNTLCGTAQRSPKRMCRGWKWAEERAGRGRIRNL